MTEQPEIKLSVEVPNDRVDEHHDELEMDQENEENKISLTLQQVDNEETERNKYGLNSPKKKRGSKDLDEDAENQDGEMTPATKLRQTADINSPKQQKSLTWGNADENGTNNTTTTNGNANALASVITQVSQNDNQMPNGSGGAQSLITQVTQDEAQAMAPLNTAQDEDDNSNESKNKNQQSSGMCACLTSLFSCCSPRTIEKRTVQQIDTHNNSKSTETAPHDTQITLADPTRKGNEIDDDAEPSEDSSTDYSFALLPPLSPENKGKRCLVLDLDETLVHSSFKPVNSADFVIPVEIDGVVHRVYVLKRPFVDEFLLECSKSYELVIFTASLSKYADPLLDQLDLHRVITHRLFRESCTLHGSAYVKDMRRLGRRLKDIIFVDNSPHSYAFQPKNAVPIASWFDDKTDTQLRDFLPVLNTTLIQVKDVRNVLDAHNKPFNWLCRQANVDISKFEQ